MQEADGRRLHSRVKGRTTLIRRAWGSRSRLHRFVRARAVTDADRHWAAAAINRLLAIAAKDDCGGG